jgi:PPOX class probable F420-dependent enzyme
MTPTPPHAASATSTPLSDRIRRFLDTTNFATIATIDSDGTPRQAVIWYTLDGDDVIINSLVGRRWPTNLLRDPRISVAITDQHDGYRWVGFTGIAVPITDQATAQADIAGMARRYHADEPEEAERLVRDRFSPQQRISFRIHPTRIHEHLD